MRLFRNFLRYSLAAGVLFLSTAAAAETGAEKMNEEIKGLKKRVEEIEAEQEEARHSYGTLSRLVDVSGYADVEFILTDEEGQNNRFRVKHLSLFFTKEIGKKWKLFTEIEYEDAPVVEANSSTDTVKRTQGLIFLEQMYIEYRPKVDYDVRAGRFLTPAGIWNIYHYPPYVPMQTPPLFHRNIFPEVSDGIQVRKTFPVKDSTLDAHVYAANGSGNPGRLDRNENKAAGARLNYSVEALGGLEFGASYYREEDNSGVMKMSYGAHLLFTRSKFSLQSEYAFRNNHPQTSRDYVDRGAYAQLSYETGKWTIAGRYDWFDSDSTDSRNDRFRQTAALNYALARNVVGKAEYNRNVFEDPALKDYNELIFAIAVATGDL